ncbi:helix-turn-helix domain-containing protein [Halomonas elongata]|uniref:helix-turn-helix domain-containing protein n=1 Tax=Halomonas elongata TaxID=2746 RepID=UPI00255AFAD8|nr:helix-turn-helix domain-containing protein [Halomonas elongata]MDL4862955.1 helix-turn-helix domain-containing protein [Halomonas elongata]
MSVEAMSWAMNQQTVTDSGARFVLVGLANHADKHGCHAFPSNATLAEYTGLTGRTVTRKINDLLSAGIIKMGNQAIAAAHIERADQRPVVYDIVMTDLPEKRGDRKSSRKKRGDTGASTGCHSDANGVTSMQERGDAVSPEPSLEPSLEPSNEPVAPGAEPADAPVEGELDLGGEPAQRIDEPRAAIPPDMPGPKDPAAKTFKPWANYAVAYRQRYGVYPIWNQRTAGQLGQLVDRVGANYAPGVAAYYLRMNNQFYVAKGHPVGLMLQDCETIAVQMQTGQQMTATRARQMDGTQANASAADEAKSLLAASGWED